MPELPDSLAEYALRKLKQRPGVEIYNDMPVKSIEDGRVHLQDRAIDAETVVLSAGVLPSPIVADLPLPRDRYGNLIVEGTMWR